MGEILPFKRKSASERNKGKSLCRHGHHKWEIEKRAVFDVKQGRLVTRSRCARCGLTRTEAI
ncbi:MAG: hypothetical protein P8106_01735 [Gammaproteobacteria bacterium]|jgi:hypothetical protein